MVALKRFSNAAFVSVMLLLGSGIGASVIHLPTLASLWQTGYGKAILVKAGLLARRDADRLRQPRRTRRAARRGRPASSAPRPPRSSSRARSCSSPGHRRRRTLSSLPPPPKALASLGAGTTVGPGR